MAGLKEIKRRLKSVQNTKKITYAMKLVAAAKLQKVQEKVCALQRYSKVLSQIFTETILAFEDKKIDLKLLEKRETIKNIRLIIIGGSRGLCAGFNTNLNKKISEVLASLKKNYPSANIEIYILGKKVVEFFRREKKTFSKVYDNLSDNVFDWPVEEILKEMEEDFLDNKVDKVFVLYTKFYSALSVMPTLEEVLPVKQEEMMIDATTDAALKIFEPTKEKLLESLLPKFLKVKFLQIALNSNASENGSRMTAMDSATNNASDLIDRLQLDFNKLRQSAITSELLDIIGGAEALK
ncbi:MAG: ATP synthase F1 subunit gamma [Bdellovibrionota bacterium]|jgi:F-type H+-transporting ATPase subunit gamma